MTFPTLYSTDFGDSPYSVDEMAGWLGEERYGYCKKMKSVKAGICSAYAFLLLRYALKKEFGLTDIPSFTRNEHGKPFLRDHPDIFFNMSHSGTRAVCAVSSRPVGADIQEIRRINLRAASKFLTPRELDEVALLPDDESRTEELSRLWCIKESVGKCTGKGFSEGFTSFGSGSLINSGKVRCERYGNYFISVCTEM